MGVTAAAVREETPIFNAVRKLYEEVADHPENQFHFPTGREACRFVGYPEAELEAIPAKAVESFAGVGYPFQADVIKDGDIVVDVGSGSGVDVLVSRLRAGEKGCAIGVDMTPAMIEKARANVRASGLDQVYIQEGRADDLPLEDESADVITSNGVINLVPDKQRAFVEMHRVLRPGGRLQIADIVLKKPVSDKSKADPQLWAECVVGADVSDDYLGSIRMAGFQDVTVIDQIDYFERSENPNTRESARHLGAHTLVITARKP